MRFLAISAAAWCFFISFSLGAMEDKNSLVPALDSLEEGGHSQRNIGTNLINSIKNKFKPKEKIDLTTEKKDLTSGLPEFLLLYVFQYYGM